MFRNLFRVLLLLIVIGFARSVISIVIRGFSELMGGGTSPVRGGREGEASNTASAARSGGELRKDPVCGTFVPVDSSISKKVGSELLYFCSADCRDKYRAA